MKKLTAAIEILGYILALTAAYICYFVLQIGWWTVLIGLLFASAGILLAGAEGLRRSVKC